MRKEYKIKQLDITDCGAACLASVCMYNGLKISIGRIRQYAYTDKTGTTVKGMIEACARLGLTGKGVMAEMEALDIVSIPVIAHVIVRNVLTHFVVIYKITKDKVTIMDPADGEYHRGVPEDMDGCTYPCRKIRRICSGEPHCQQVVKVVHGNKTTQEADDTSFVRCGHNHRFGIIHIYLYREDNRLRTCLWQQEPS